MILKTKSVYTIFLPATEQYPAQWINLAAMEKADFNEIEGKPTAIVLYYSSGSKDVFKGDRAQIIVQELIKTTA